MLADTADQFSLQEPTFRLTLRDVPWCVALGILGVGIPQSLVFVGNNLVGAAYAPIMVPTTPVYVALLSAAFGMEAFNRYKVRTQVPATCGGTFCQRPRCPRRHIICVHLPAACCNTW